MFLRKIAIINYKNLREATLELSPKINCFIGSNGMGKTNVLDAVYYLSFCRSYNVISDSLVINHDAQYAVLEGDYEDDGDVKEHIYAGLKRGVKKHFRRNKKEYKRLSEHIGLIPIVFVSPEDTDLVRGSSEDRRKMMDVVISQYDHSYITALARYNKALQQRNVMLKQEQEPDEDLMSLLEEEMAQTGETVYRLRNDFITRLIPVFQHFYDDISGGKEVVNLNYVSHCQRGPLLDVIRRDRFKDRAVGYSLHGIHRDDLEMTLDGYTMKKEGSQGQCKTFVIALKLALFDFLCGVGNKTVPILLLDDIFDKLDSSRVERIVNLVASNSFGQIFITDTNRDNLDKILQKCNTDYRLFNVNEGEVINV